jgi:hypothetical protein
MGILNIFSKSKGEQRPLEIPAGTVTVDRQGQILGTTLPASVPQECIAQIIKPILAAFVEAREAQISLNEIVINYSALKITAKELRGGAMIFLAPHGPQRQG